jgi:hypothetical protein
VRWMRRRRASFARLVREGTLAPTFDVAAGGLARVVGSPIGRVAGRMAFGAVGSTIAQVYGGPVVGAEIDGQVIEARTVADTGGRFRLPSYMLAHPEVRYVALLHGAGWIAPQRVLRRRPAESAS